MESKFREVWVFDSDLGAQFLYRDLIGFKCRLTLFTSYEEFRRATLGGNPALLIADLRADGGRFYEFIRSEKSRDFRGRVPFMIVSMVEDPDLIRESFALGAIDFLTKPFSRAEITVKIERVLAHSPAGRGTHLPLSLDPASLTAAYGDARTPALTTREFQILSLIWEFGHGSVDRVEIIQRIWGDLRVGSKTLDVHLSNLRKKLACVGLRILRDRMGALRLEPAEPGVAAQAASGGLPEPPPLL